MNKFKKLVILGIVSLLFIGNIVFAAPQPQKIAVVDLQKVVAKSSQVQSLKALRERRNKELAAFIKNAQADVNKQTTAAKKKSVAANYEKQIQSKREANAKEYTTKLKAADANITAIIRQKATAMGYTMVIPKASVICGGDDITASILPLIK